MHRTALLFAVICFILISVGSYFAASKAVDYLEAETEAQVTEALTAAGEEWASVNANGLRVELGGLAPDEASRFNALEIVGKVIETTRLKDEIAILQTSNVAPPRFTLEVLRNVDQVSLIGLIPESDGSAGILSAVQSLSPNIEVTDMLESADYPVTAEWHSSLNFGLGTLNQLPRSKISVTDGKVIVTAVTESVVEKRNIEAQLKGRKPENMQLVMNISSPRPVISPFSFRMQIGPKSSALISCSADTRLTRDKIMRVVREVELSREPTCDIGLGVPTTDWADAVVMSVASLRELGGGVLTFTDSDVSLVASNETTQQKFDQVVGKLENALPELFSLHAVLPPKILSTDDANKEDTPEFLATVSPEGIVQLRGRVSSEQTKKAIDTYATSLFGNDIVYVQTRVDENLPNGWPVRVLGGLEALAQLNHGILIVQPSTVEIKGIGARPEVPSEVTKILSSRISGKGNYKIDVDFDEALFVVNEAPSEDDCARGITALLSRKQINFEPGSTRMDADSLLVVSEIADILRKCPDAKFNIEGHTDSQGGEDLNLAISQKRAEAVLNALLSQRVLTSGLTAVGFGPSQPIADNGTEEGRAQNRRIAFTLVAQKTNTTATEASAKTEDEQEPAKNE